MKALGPWEPDISDLDTETLDIARNTYPGINSWLPAAGPVVWSEALPSAPRGFFYAQRTDGTYDTFVGTATKLYKFNSASLEFDDVSRLLGGDYAVPENDYWSFTQYGQRLIAGNLQDTPQYIDIDTGTNFAALPNAPVARFWTVMEDRLIASCLATNSEAIKWSDVNDSENWTPTTGGSLAGDQEFPDHGAVQGVFPHAGVVMLERGLRSIIPTYDTSSFRFPELTSQKGTVAPYATVELGNTIFWLSDDDFYFGNAESQRGLGAKRFAAYFFEQLNLNRIYQMYATFDPFATRVMWAYPTGDTDYNDRIIGIDWSLDRAFEMEIDTYVLGRLARPGYTLEALETVLGYATLADVPVPFGSRTFMGGQPLFARIGTDFKLASFEGPNLAATFETGTLFLGAPKRARLRKAWSYVEGAGGDDVTLQVASMNKLSQTPTYGSAVSQQAQGHYPLNDDGKFHKLKFVIPAEKTWKHAKGYDLDFVVSSEW